MITTLITLLIIVLIGLIIWYVIGLFIPDPRIKNIIGLIIGLVILLYALKLFNIAF